AASTKAHSRRCASAIAADTVPGSTPPPASSSASLPPPHPGPPGGGEPLTSAQHHDRPHLDAPEAGRADRREVQGGARVTRRDQVVAAYGLFGLNERAVGHHVAPDGGGGGRGLQGPALDDLAALRRDLLGEPAVCLHHLLEHVGRGGGVCVLVLTD